MQAWWRVLRGVIPYKWKVVLSMLCALGVGLSYASGVVVMYPVMKIFVSAEQLQGWSDRVIVQSRMGLDLDPLDTNVDHGEHGLVIAHLGDNAPESLKGLHGRLVITRVSLNDPQAQTAAALVTTQPAQSEKSLKDDWKQLIHTLS